MSHNLPGRNEEYPSIPSVLYDEPVMSPRMVLPQPPDENTAQVDWSKLNCYLPASWKQSYKNHVKSIIYRYINMVKKIIEAYIVHEEIYLEDYNFNIQANMDIWTRFENFMIDPEICGEAELFDYDYMTHVAHMLCPQTARQDVEMIKMFREGRNSCRLMIGELLHMQGLLMEAFARYQEMVQYGSERDMELPEMPRTLDEERWDEGIYP